MKNPPSGLVATSRLLIFSDCKPRRWAPVDLLLSMGVEESINDLPHHCHQRDFSERARCTPSFIKLREHRDGSGFALSAPQL